MLRSSCHCESLHGNARLACVARINCLTEWSGAEEGPFHFPSFNEVHDSFQGVHSRASSASHASYATCEVCYVQPGGLGMTNTIICSAADEPHSHCVTKRLLAQPNKEAAPVPGEVEVDYSLFSEGA